MPKVSVVIPAYNAERYLAECLESVLGQSFAAMEVIVVDDGSTDGTAAIAQRHLPRIRYHHQENQGVAGALNTGIGLATGEYVSFVASDDGLCPGTTECQVEQLERHSEVGLVHGGATIIDEHSRVVAQTPRRATGGVDVIESTDAIRALLRGNDVICSSVAIRRRWLDQLGGFSQESVPGEDWEMWMRVAARSAVAYIRRPLALRRFHGASLTSAFTVESFGLSHERILNTLFSEPPLAGNRDLESYAYAANDRTLATLAANLRERREFTRHIARALRRRPTLLAEARTWSALFQGGKAFTPGPVMRAARTLRHRRAQDPSHA